MSRYHGLNETELVLLLKKGDENALRPLYDMHVVQLHHFIIRTAKSKQLAEDVVHDVFVKIWEKRAQIDSTQPFKTYLYSIAKNHLLNLLKRARHEHSILEEIRKYAIPIENTTDWQIEFTEGNAVLNEAMEKLPEQCRQVFIRCKIQGLSYREAAAELGITEGTVNAQMVKALRIIREYISFKNAILLVIAYLSGHH
ncbi:RNA polymerase sigma factor [Pedobacter deserti]|uniref:RNA polymerase sigma factor n=1 Tax=Pedobacter deserti TaxID=2817382 RepID=UPI00210A0253|nr:RNA polymerase sigma-70 factor [Pedobacter sp. SYSU D00382]